MKEFLLMLPVGIMLVAILVIMETDRLRHKRRVERNYRDFKERSKRP